MQIVSFEGVNPSFGVILHYLKVQVDARTIKSKPGHAIHMEVVRALQDLKSSLIHGTGWSHVRHLEKTNRGVARHDVHLPHQLLQGHSDPLPALQGW